MQLLLYKLCKMFLLSLIGAFHESGILKITYPLSNIAPLSDILVLILQMT